MAERERDLFGPLAGAWRRLEPPRADAELGELDAETRRAVELLRAAWSAVEAPAGLSLPRRAPAALPAARAARFAARAAPGAAAAALLLALGGAAALGYRIGAAAPRGAAVARRGGVVSTLPFGAAASVEHLSAERIELSAGNVRLVLLTGGAPGAEPASDDERMDR